MAAARPMAEDWVLAELADGGATHLDISEIEAHGLRVTAEIGLQ